MLTREHFGATGGLTALLLCLANLPVARAGNAGSGVFHKQIEPILEDNCFNCHADGANKGHVAFDEFKSDQAVLDDRELWSKVLKNVRAGIMPPSKRKVRPNQQQKEQIAEWIKRDVFRIDPRNPDPGRVTVRRLNRVEYHNTIRDLMGVDFDTQTEFPPDDTGYGFDDIGDVLTLPPMLLEKYVAAAERIVGKAKPLTAGLSKDAPGDADGRRTRAREVLGNFALRAFRRPPGDKTVNRLVALAESIYSQPGSSFEQGIAQAMVAVLASPRFLFREERAEPVIDGQTYPYVDEYSLGSRLSYFLWSSMPDEELMKLAGQGRLRENLSGQVERMLKDKRSQAFIRNFSGQWLRARDVESVPIEARAVLAREAKVDPEREQHRARFRELRNKPPESLSQQEKDELETLRASFRRQFARRPRVEADEELRRSMRMETEKVFDYVIRDDRSVLELVDSDYTFLNERLASLYGITNVAGQEMRLVKLPPDSPRGGVLTEGTVLMVTSNPTRTSPVKRGLFILDSILGTPPPPPPPDIPPLEDAAKGVTGHVPTLRETLAIHRKDALCSSCHNRMDPLGLAFENFNAMGMWRNNEFAEPIDASGKLITGEQFSDVKELKRILIQNHKEDFYRTLTEKLLTYALGRGLEDYDTETVDEIVGKLEKSGGRSSILLTGVIDSAPFQKCRKETPLTQTTPRAQNTVSDSREL